jgi:acyl-homoserine lactone acylase PvdQ
MRTPATLLALALLGCKAEFLPAAPGAVAAGLRAPATVRIDALGIAHIDAASEHDAVFLQGYTTARLRMGQMVLLRRRAHGTRAEVLGEDYFLDDWQMRALGFTDLGAATWDALQDDDPESAASFAAYAEGVNAYLAAVDAGDEDASPRLMAMGVDPAPWTPEDSLAIEKLIIAGSTMRVTQELLVGLARQFMGEDLFADLYRYAPLDAAVIVPGFVLEAACPDIGTDLSACTWGRVHTLGHIDPAAGFLPGADVPAQPKTGGLSTVDAADFPLLEGGVLPDHFAVDNAPSNRFLFELDPAGIRGAWVLPGGQDEDPESPYHSDQFDLFMAGELVAMPLTAAEVEAAAVETWDLEAGFGG